MKSFTYAIAALALSAGAALAGGHEQHAAQLGVDPALYTEAQLIELGEAIRENDAAKVAWLKSRSEGGNVTRSVSFRFGEGAHQGKEMLAKIAGVNVNDYTLAELTEMTANMEND